MALALILAAAAGLLMWIMAPAPTGTRVVAVAGLRG